MTTAISATGLGKRYKIAHDRDPYGRLSESLSGAVRSPLQRLRGSSKTETEWFWALRDASFEIDFGQVVGHRAQRCG